MLATLVSDALTLLLPDAMTLLVLDLRGLLGLDSLVMLLDSLVLLVRDTVEDWRMDVMMVDISSEVRILVASYSVRWHCCFSAVGGSLCFLFCDLFLLTDSFAIVLFLEDLHGMGGW